MKIGRRRLNQSDFIAMLLAQGAVIPCGKCKEPIADPKNIMREHVQQLAMEGKDTVCNQQLWHKKPCSHEKSYGTKVTTLNSDAHARAKVRRLTGQNKEKPKRKWPTRKLQSRPFPKYAARRQIKKEKKQCPTPQRT